jgi:hypothetical protein
MNDFNLQKFLVENKMTRNSRLLSENESTSDLNKLAVFLSQHTDEIKKLIPSLASIPGLDFEVEESFDVDDDGNSISAIVPVSSDFEWNKSHDVAAEGGNFTFDVEPKKGTFWGNDEEANINGTKFYYGSFNF